MIGQFRILDRDGERRVELPRTVASIGVGHQDTIAVSGDLPEHSVLSTVWDARRATWVLRVVTALTVPVFVNERAINAGEQVPLTDLDAVSIGDVILQFRRLPAAPTLGDASVERVVLDDAPLIIGRFDAQATVDTRRLNLDHEETSISRNHVRIEKHDGDYHLEDLSDRGIEVNGLETSRVRLVYGDRFRVSGYIFEFNGDTIRRIQPAVAGSISSRNVTFTANHRLILAGISLDVAAGEFIGVLGGSGQGKSTFLNALCGINPPSTGDVRIGGIPLSDRERLREIGIGYVPQDDIVHKELTVLEAITFSARLRLKLTRREIDILVATFVERLGLTEHVTKRVADLSGGQRKRVSIAIELLSKPSVLFLDEPSSGLDPATEESLMTLLQSLTLTKLTVICTTHVLQKAYLFDRIVFIQGGRLVFAGDSNEARRHFLFGNAEEHGAELQFSPLERVYALLANSGKSAEEWEQAYLQSPYAARAFPLACLTTPDEVQTVAAKQPRVSSLKTLSLLAARQWRILRADFLNIAFILIQPILIGLLVGWVGDRAALRLFLCVVATMWFGCSNGAQQIVAELPIFRRERVSGQGVNAYILSKFGFLSLITLAQAILLLTTTLVVARVFHPDNLDRANIFTELTEAYGPQEPPSEDQAASFDAQEDDATAGKTAATPAVAAAKPKRKPGLGPWAIKAALALGEFTQVTQNMLDSGPRVLTKTDGTPLRDDTGKSIVIPGTPLGQLLFTVIGLRLAAIVAAALTSVAIGLMISSLVANTTQAVLWVPLVLIPQILFGGVVVQVPDMSPSVRAFSYVMPSFSAQRIMDVSAIYGLAVPSLSNRTKTPVFLTSRGEKETVNWQAESRPFSEVYDKVSPVNASWQNLAVIADQLGQHKRVGDRSEDGFHIEYRDTVEQRHDVRYSKGTLFLSLQPVTISLAVLGGWVVLCYGVIYFGMLSKQAGK